MAKKLLSALQNILGLASMAAGYVLVTGGANLGLGAHVRARPLLGLIASGLGLTIWIASYFFIRKLPWERTYRFATFFVLPLLALFHLFGTVQSGEQTGGDPAYVPGLLGPLSIFGVGYAFATILAVVFFYLLVQKTQREK